MKRIAVSLGITQVIIAIGAIPAGLSMIFEPDGMGIGMSTEMLSGSPFKDFLIPGLFLFTVNGLCNGFGAYLSFRKNRYAGMFGLGLGIVLILWICVQVFFIGLTHFLQPVFLVIGVIETTLGYAIMIRIQSIARK